MSYKFYKMQSVNVFRHHSTILANTCIYSNYHCNGNMKNSFLLLGSQPIFQHLQFLPCNCEIKYNDQEPNDI